MINLMYLVFIAMMAMNDTSSEVLSGFELVEKSLRESAATAADRNRKTLEELEAANRVNPTKVGEWYKKGMEVKKQSDELFEYIQQLKLRIIRQADGKDANVDQLQHKEDLDAASEIMLSPMGSEAAKLKKRLEAYRAAMSRMVDDPEKRAMLERAIDTKVPGKSGLNLRSWETALFENMPMASAVTILTKYQNDIRYVEGEALASIARSVDVGDYRVNKIVAQVVPKSQIVMSGTPYEAAIVLSAIDSTQRPQLFIGPRGSEREVVGYDGTYTVGTGATGTFPVQGYLKVPGKDPYYFSSEYSVSAKTATVASALMRVLYAGRVRENEIEIAVPESRLAEVSVGMPAAVALWANSAAYTGILRELSPVPDAATRTYTARIALTDAPADLPLGMTARVRLGASVQDGAAIPLSALYQTGDTAQVYVVEDDAVHLVPVTVTAFRTNDALVTGLPQGARIVTAGVHQLHEGEKVRTK